jgi:hypothetical protein
MSCFGAGGPRHPLTRVGEQSPRHFQGDVQICRANLEVNPALYVERLPSETREMDFLTPGELRAFFAVVPNIGKRSLTAVLMGMRWRERGPLVR